MTPDLPAITLLILLSTGEVREYPDYPTEWSCVTKAAQYQERGYEAYCLIRTPDEIGPLEKYPR